MGRPRAKLDRLGQADLVIERLKSEPAGRLRERLLAIRDGLEGEFSLEQIAERAGRSRATIQNWFDAYRQGGVEALGGAPVEKRGRKPALDERAWKQLRKKLARGSFRTAGQAREWIIRRFEVQRTESTVRRWMGKLGARLKVVRPRHAGSDEGARQRFRSQLARLVFEALKDKAVGFRDRPLRLWVADEGRFGLKPCHRRAWVSRGVRAHKNNRRSYQWSHVWAALQVGGAGSEFFYSNQVDKVLSGRFLEQISRRDPFAIHVVIWDGAGFHPEQNDPLVPDNVVLLRQPPYSPELNPVERLWDMLRDALCNRSWCDLQDLMRAVTRWLREFWQDPRRIFSLVGEGWMLTQVNA